jgi:hypothetical protein
VDLHLLLLAGFTGAPKFLRFAPKVGCGWLNEPASREGCGVLLSE